MDDRPIDPFNPYARRYSPPSTWPEQHPSTPAPDDTQEVPVVPPAHEVPPAPVNPAASASMDDTQEVPVIPPQPAAPPPEWPVTAQPEPTALVPPGQPSPPGQPTAPVSAPAAPFGPELTVPPDLVTPKKPGPRKAPLIAVGASVLGLLVLVTVAIFAFQPGTADGSQDKAEASSDTPDSSGDASSSSPEESKSPSKNPKPETEKSSDAEPGGEPEDDGGDDNAEPELSVPSRPTKFGAWFAGNGTYQAKWGPPSSDGNADILSYVIGDCKGNNLAFVDSNTYKATVQADYLECMSVYAVNNQGMGQDAQHQITNNP